MTSHSKAVVDKFCELCDWLHQTWQTKKYLFDKNPDFDNLKQPHYAHFFHRLSVILQEYSFQQLAKLHDPAVQGGQNGHINLSIDYMIEYCQWNTKTQATLVDLKNKMMTLAKPIKEARNKILSHNDLTVILQSKDLGYFAPGEDEAYFDCLHQFASIMKEAVDGGPFVYNNLVKNDIDIFMQCFNRGRIT